MIRTKKLQDRRNKILNYGQDVLKNSNINSGFSSWEFHSIDEFSIDQSTVINKNINFERNWRQIVPSKVNGSQNPSQLFEYKPTFRDDKRSRDRALK